ncbi:MAG: iron transporter, partial [Methylobacteriaceae bacterium]|nr:iron transporter [Methylobacteriaceae bacterium]
MKLIAPAFAAAIALLAAPLAAKEYPIGKPQTKGGMEVAAVYLQPIEMDPPDVMRAAKDSDVHLEADIKAAKDNKNGFSEGDWIPCLVVTYELTKLDSKETQKG